MLAATQAPAMTATGTIALRSPAITDMRRFSIFSPEYGGRLTAIHSGLDVDNGTVACSMTHVKARPGSLAITNSSATGEAAASVIPLELECQGNSSAPSNSSWKGLHIYSSRNHYA